MAISGRVQVNTETQRPDLLNPQASPIDSYVKPGDPAKSPLWALADSLGTLDKSLGDYVTKSQADAKAENDAAGQVQRWQEVAANGSDAPAVAAGIIPTFESPSFMDGKKKVDAQIAGDQIGAKLQTAYQAWDGKNSPDQNGFSQFTSQFIGNNLGNAATDPKMAQYLMPILHQHVENVRRQWMSDLNANTYQQGLVGRYALMSQAVDNSTTQALSTGNPIDTDTLGQQIMQQRQDALASGVRENDIDDGIVKTMTAKAIEKGDPTILRVLDQQVPGKPYKYTDIPSVNGELDKTARIIEVRQKQADTEANSIAEKVEKQRFNSVMGAVVTSITMNPGAPIPEAVLQQLTAHDPKARIEVIKMQDDMATREGKDDPTAVNQAYMDMAANPQNATQAFYNAMTQRVFNNRQSLKDAYDWSQKVSDDKAGQVFKGPTFTMAEQYFKSAFAPNALEKTFNPEGWTDKGMAAWTEYQRMLMDWSGQHPRASISDINKVQGDILGDMRSRIQTDAQGKATGFTPQQELANPLAAPAPRPSVGTFQNASPQGPAVPGIPTSGGLTPIAPPDPRGPHTELAAAQAAAPPRAPAFTPPASPEGRSWYESLPDGQQQRVNAAAQKIGVPLDTYIDTAYQRTQSPFVQASQQLQLNPQEQALYQMHLQNLTGPGGVDNPDGSRSSLFQSVQEHDGKYYNIPTVWNGKIETEKVTTPSGQVMQVPNATALANVEKAGWDKFPSYATPEEADARYEQMHQFMDKDTAKFLQARNQPATPPVTNPQGQPLTPAQQAFNSGNLAEAARLYAAESSDTAHGDLTTGDLPRALIKHFLGTSAPAPQATPAAPVTKAPPAAAPTGSAFDQAAQRLGIKPLETTPPPTPTPAVPGKQSKLALPPSPVRTASLGDADLAQAVQSSRTPLQLAASFIGSNETDHADVLKAFFTRATGKVLDPQTTPWCAKFVNSVLASTGFPGTGSDMARSFLGIGTKVKTEEAQPGDVIVFPRGKGGVYGHVGFIQSIDPDNDRVQVLAGNQGGAAQKGGGVTVQTFPLSRALGVRRITKKVAMNAPDLPGDTDNG